METNGNYHEINILVIDISYFQNKIEYGKQRKGSYRPETAVCSCPFCVYGTFGLFVQKWKGELMKYMIHRLYVPP